MADANTPGQILDFLEARSGELTRFVMDLAHQNSYSWNKAGTDAVARMVLERLGGALPNHRVVA